MDLRTHTHTHTHTYADPNDTPPPKQHTTDRNILASTLLDDLTTWHLEENGEEAALQRFRGAGVERQESFNSSGKRIAQRDPVLDALLESSGVHLKRVGSVDVVVADDGAEEEGSDGGGSRRQEQQPEQGAQRMPAAGKEEKGRGEGAATAAAAAARKREEGIAHARLHRLQQAEAMAAAAAAASTRASTPTPSSPRGEGGALTPPAPTHHSHLKPGARSLPASPAALPRLAGAGPRRGPVSGGGSEVAIRFHSPSRLSGLAEDVGRGGGGGDPSSYVTAVAVAGEEDPQEPAAVFFSALSSPMPSAGKAAAPGTATTTTTAAAVKAPPPVVLVADEFLLTPGRRRAFKCGARLLGEPLSHLVRDPNTCRLALLDPSLGVPYVFEEVRLKCRGMVPLLIKPG